MIRQKISLPIALIAASLLVAAPADAKHSSAARAKSVVFERGMVSAADPRAAEAGAEMLRAGGSATDAAIATMLALSVVEPQSSGIGGGGFLVASNVRGLVSTYDGRETAPAAASPHWFEMNGSSFRCRKPSPAGAVSVCRAMSR